MPNGFFRDLAVMELPSRDGDFIAKLDAFFGRQFKLLILGVRFRSFKTVKFTPYLFDIRFIHILKIS